MKRNYNGGTYIYGSEAPKEMPVRIPRNNEELVRKIKKERYAKENQRRARRFGLVYTMGIIAAVFITMYSCISYINVLNRQNENSKNISSLTNEVETLKEKNDQKKLQIDTSINYDYIYKVATKELGMVHAGRNQVVEYKSGESEYVIQYFDLSSES